MIYYNGNNAMNVIKRKYIERFGEDDLSRASLRMISNEDGFLIIRCNLSCYMNLRETFLLLNDMIISLNTSGTLKALGSRMDDIKKKFKGIDNNTVKSKLNLG